VRQPRVADVTGLNEPGAQDEPAAKTCVPSPKALSTRGANVPSVTLPRIWRLFCQSNLDVQLRNVCAHGKNEGPSASRGLASLA
jgi:hypothetical protein